MPDQSEVVVFVSYSRKDSAHANALVADLEARGFKAKIDKRDLPFGEEWKNVLAAFIVDADAIVWLVSPNSIRSRWCQWEVGEVARLNKRIVPIRIGEIEAQALPEAIGRSHILPPDGFYDSAAHLDALDTALRRDWSWLQEHTRLVALAERWDLAARPSSHLLQIEEIEAATRWRERRPPEAPSVPDMLVAFLDAGRAKALADAQREREQFARTARFQRRLGWALGGVALLLMATFVNVAMQNYETTRREQIVFAGLAEKAYGEKQYERGMRYALQAYPAPGSLPWPFNPFSTDLEGKLAGGAIMSPLVRSFGGTAQDQAKVSGISSTARAIAVSANGAQLAIGRADGTGGVFDTMTGNVVIALRREGDIQAVALSADGGRVMTVTRVPQGLDAEFRVELADTASPEGRRRIHIADCASCAALSADGRLLALSKGENITVVDAASGRPQHTLPGFSDWPHSIKFSRDATRLAVAWSSPRGVLIWDLRGNAAAVSLDLANTTVPRIDFNAKGDRLIVSGTTLTSASIRDASSGRELHEVKHAEGILTTALFDPFRDTLVTSSSDARVVIWNADARPIQQLKGHTDRTEVIAFDGTGWSIATASRDGSIRVWTADNGTERARFQHDGAVHSLAFVDGGSALVSVSTDGTVRVWDVRAGKRTSTFENLSGGSPVLDGRARRIAFKSARDIVSVAEIDGRSPVTELSVGSYGGAAVLDHEGRRLAFKAADGVVQIHDLDPPAGMIDLQIGGEVSGIAMSRDGSTVAILSGEYSAVPKRASIWRKGGGSGLIELRANSNESFTWAFALDPFGSRLLTTTRAGLASFQAQIWAIGSSEPSLLQAVSHEALISATTFSPDGNLAATGSDDKTARVWDGWTGAPKAVMRGHLGPIRALAFSPDARRLVTASDDRTLRLWDVGSGREMARQDTVGIIHQLAFTGDGRQVTGVAEDRLSFDSFFAHWNIAASPLAGAALREHICNERFGGAEHAFTRADLEESFLADVAVDASPSARQPCLRRGSLSPEYWVRMAKRLFNFIGAAKP